MILNTELQFYQIYLLVQDLENQLDQNGQILILTMELLTLINLVSTYLKKEYSQNLLKRKVQFVTSQFPILSFHYFRNIRYGMKSKKTFVENSGANLIGYSYKIMASRFILAQLVNGLLNLQSLLDYPQYVSTELDILMHHY